MPPDEYKAFMLHVVNNQRNLEKIAVLFGYLPSQYYLDGGNDADDVDGNGDDDDENSDGNKKKSTYFVGVSGGDHASMLVVQAIQTVSLGGAAAENDCNKDQAKSTLSSPDHELCGKVNRSFGCNARASSSPGLLEQDAHTGALSEVLCTMAPPLLGSDEDGSAQLELQKWISDVNTELKRVVNDLKDNMPPEAARCHPGEIRIFGRVSISNKKFNAETDVTCRRVEYLMPLDFLVPTMDDKDKAVRIPQEDSAQDISASISERQVYFDSLPSFRAGKNSRLEEDGNGGKVVVANERPSPPVLMYLHRMKKIMQRFSTHVVELDVDDAGAVLEKEFATKSRKRQKGKHQARRNEMRDEKRKREGKDGGSKGDEPKESEEEAGDANQAIDETTSTEKGETEEKYKNANVLKRKRYHNFSPRAVAHEYLSFRRMDRFYHKATIRYGGDEEGALGQNKRPFVLLSLTGDMFLNGQAQSVMGLFVAICQGIIDEDIIDCIFDEEYPSLVPAPMMPRTGLYASEAQYMAWEGRLQTVLNARRGNCVYENGWCDEATNNAVEQWRACIDRELAKAWCRGGILAQEDGRLNAEKVWVEDYLKPWGKRANEQLRDYRRWKRAQKLAAETPGLSLVDELLPPLNSVDSRIPELFARVLKCLQDADSSGKWPATTPKRQLVMVSTKEDGAAVSESLSSAHMKAKSNNVVSASAYSFAEGQGGASGSFSVGAFPPSYDQPKANEIFPDLMKAAFELEVALRPDREPSSTIAVNRNSQFRPHTDSGAGAGQSTSLIVGLGHYVGGELMVEGEKKDIRYKAVEFNGWKQRHWTLPFTGERFSLVWFTPKGCEGIHGIDL